MEMQTYPKSLPNTTYIVPLRAVTRADVNRVGTKAANLGELAHANFTVPDGFVLTTQAFDRFMRANALSQSNSPEQVAHAPLPPDIADAIHAAMIPLTETKLAVRSSGVVQAWADPSITRHYQTILGVRGYDALADAVRKCWASAFSEEDTVHSSNQVNMAVLVQRLVSPDAAGVALTVNPTNGHQNETVVNAVRGLGERLASGSAKPDNWTVDGEVAVRHGGHEGAINAELAREVAAMARQAEEYFGVPQDVEWALKGDELFMLEARPITTLSEATKMM